MSCPSHDIDAGGNCRACGYNIDAPLAEALARGEAVYGYTPEVSDEERAAWEAEQERDAALNLVPIPGCGCGHLLSQHVVPVGRRCLVTGCDCGGES